jgi:heme/copper-type cytochrome/quinol oxidase subunit 3
MSIGDESVRGPADTVEPPELFAGNIRVGTRLAAAATLFVFFCPFFAYFYLRTLNTAGMWRPAGLSPPAGFGVAIMVLFAGSSVLLCVAAYSARLRGWRALVAGSLALGVAGVVLQVVEYSHLSFGPSDGGYASVFLAWTALTAVVALGVMVWLETLLAFGLRHREIPAWVLRPRVEGLAFYWAFIVALSFVMWVVLYLIGS